MKSKQKHVSTGALDFLPKPLHSFPKPAREFPTSTAPVEEEEPSAVALGTSVADLYRVDAQGAYVHTEMLQQHAPAEPQWYAKVGEHNLADVLFRLPWKLVILIVSSTFFFRAKHPISFYISLEFFITGHSAHTLTSVRSSYHYC